MKKSLGLKAEDVVNKTILLVLDGTRKWDCEKHSNIETYLKWNIRSVINHSFNNIDSTCTTRFPVDSEENENIPHPTSSEIDPYTESTKTRTPEELILEEKEFTEFNVRLLASLVDFPELEELASCFMYGLSKPQQISEELGISVSEVNNQKKRLRRILGRVYNKP